MNVRRGEVVLVDFPYSDHMGSKVRPALVVQADVWNQRLDDTILALITSSRHRRVGAATQLPLQKGSKRACGSTRSSNAKICSRTIKDSFYVSWVVSQPPLWSRLTPVSKLRWAFRRGV
jgi:mRNA-degrading endonuclease toxin of MazEF toxin-antitoxin module